MFSGQHEGEAMSEDEWDAEVGDGIADRAMAVMSLGINADGIKDKAVKDRMLKAMDLVNDSISATIKPSKKNNTLVLFQKPEPEPA